MKSASKITHAGGIQIRSGRKKSLTDGAPRTVYLTNEDVARAKKLGNGTISAGIRKALEIASNNE